jgi:diguanylate cyclase (GGDEF)-like protein
MYEAERRSRLLVVDDSALNISVLGEALVGDYDLTVAKSGEEALEILGGDNLPDLILLDIIMPGMDGFDVLRHIKEDDATKDIPVIFITAMTGEDDEAHGLAMGAVDYITKPFSIPIVKARVRTHVQLKRKSDMLQRLSDMDALTGIPNRRRFDEWYDKEWRRAMREGAAVSVIMMDIDYFKKYNDNYGHGEGDICLRTVAQALRGCLNRSTDMVARYGGEEFIAMLPATEGPGAAVMAETMRKAVLGLQLPHEFSECSEYVTISVGVATVMPAMGMSRDELVRTADEMLYKAKQAGRNRVERTILG